MNLEKCALLTRFNINSRWYRAVEAQYLDRVIDTAHTPLVPGRFAAGTKSSPSFRVLYLAETPGVALNEVRAFLAADRPFAIAPVDVYLTDVADLTEAKEAELIATNAQELTGDWAGYAPRSARCVGSGPHNGEAPTQQLGKELYRLGTYQGLVAFVPTDPTRKILVIFPERLSGSSSTVRYCYQHASGRQESLEIP